MNILGLNAFHGDASAALLRDGVLVAAIEEERINRIKHWAGLPSLAAAACLAGTNPAELEHIAISRDPRANFGRKLLRVATHPASWGQVRNRASNSVRVSRVGSELALAMPEYARARVHNVEHHRAHLASAFFCSPFEEAAIASIDGFGDFSSSMWGIGRGNRFDVQGAIRFPHSLGCFTPLSPSFLAFLTTATNIR